MSKPVIRTWVESAVTASTVVPAIELIDVSKRFGPVTANDHISFDVFAGEVHALVGENGAGKSTLMSMVSGLYRPDDGQLRVGGQPRAFRSPRDAIAAGIGMVYQHFMLVDTMTVTENMLLGLPAAPFALNTAAIADRLRGLSAKFGLDVDPDAPIWQLSVGQQQRVEILRLLFREARIIVLDEPTAVLTPLEADRLIGTVRTLAASGYAIIFISHKLDEVLKVADRITILRRGRSVATLNASGSNRNDLARMMVGRDLAPAPPARVLADSPEVLVVDHLSARSDRAGVAVDDLSLSVRAGEIVGIAGVAGNGQRELVETLTGLRQPLSGTITINGAAADRTNPGTIAGLGLAHIPEDRLATGLAGGASLETNAALRHYRSRSLTRGPLLRRRAMAAFADRIIRDHDVKAPNRRIRARQLSGGNQQKLIIGRELAGEPVVIVASYPTRGVDIAASEAIHLRLRVHRDRGAAVLLVSEDLEELRLLSDRIAVMVGGRIVDTVRTEIATLPQIALLMAGVAPGDQAAHA